jgi:hypothetical protein
MVKLEVKLAFKAPAWLSQVTTYHEYTSCWIASYEEAYTNMTPFEKTVMMS